MGEMQAGHGLDHVQRVLGLARKIQDEVGGNRLVIELAAVLHDVGDAKFHDGFERSAEFSREILSERGADNELIDHVCHIVDNLSFRKRESAETLSLEGQIVQDADRLDALGALGIVRTIEYGAFKSQPFLRVHPTEKCGMDHFDDKLFQLKDLMNTDAAKKIAEARESFMRNFVGQLEAEIEGRL